MDKPSRDGWRALPDLARRWLFGGLERFRIGDQAFHLALACAIGAISGLAVSLFMVLIRGIQGIFFGNLLPALPSPFLLSLLPALGGLLIAPLILRLSRDAGGEGIPHVMEAVALGGSIIRLRRVAVRTICVAVTIGSGGSVGRAAPSAELGASVGSAAGRYLRVSGDLQRSLVGCGAAGGIAAVFNAPIGGVFFALEVLLGDFSAQTFAPIVISSVVATAVSRGLLGNGLVYRLTGFDMASVPQALLCAPLGALCGAAAVLFIRGLGSAERSFSASRLPDWSRAAVGGMLTGLIAVRFPQVLGTLETDAAALADVLRDPAAWAIPLWIAFLKITSTSLSLGSGGSGGVIGPSMMIGGMVGAAAGHAAHAAFPELAGPTAGFAVVGMAAFLAPVIGGPLTAILLLFEMTGSYASILPLLVAVIFSMLVAGRFSRFSLYTGKLHERGIDLVRGKEERVLTALRVRDAMAPRPQTIAAGATFAEVCDRFLDTPADYLYLTDDSGTLTGVISFADVRPHIRDERVARLVVARDLATRDPVAVTPEESLLEALERFGYKNVSQLPVISDPHTRRLIGTLHRKEILEAYHGRVLAKAPPNPEGPLP